MRVIKHSILVKVDDSEKHGLLIHALNGNISVLTQEEVTCVEKWMGTNEIQTETDSEITFFEELSGAGFFKKSDEEEEALVQRIMTRCRKIHESIVDNSSKAAVFVLTYQCNFACPYCYEHAPEYNEKKVMLPEMVDRILEISGNALEDIALYGGEPLLPETRSIVEYIVSRAPHANYSVTTNGYYLPEFLDIFKELNVNHLMVTLDGDQELHNKTRVLKNGEGTFQKVLDGIELYLTHRIPIKVRMNITPANVERCTALRDRLIEKFSQQYTDGILMFELQPVFQLSDDVKSELHGKLFFEKATPAGISPQYNIMSLTVSPVLNAFVNNRKQSFRPRYCHCDAEGKRRFYDAEGNIYSCILSLKNSAASVGTYHPQYQLKQQSILTRNIETIEACKSCKLKFLCGGGCANAILTKDGDVMKSNCAAIIREVYYELPKLFRKYTQQEQ